MPQTPAGWYPDPEDRSQSRYWDGAAWTEHTSPSGAEPTVPLPAGYAAAPPPPPPPSKPWYARGPAIAVGAVGALVVLIAALGSLGGGDDSSNASAPAAGDSPEAVKTVTLPPTPEPKSKAAKPKAKPQQPESEVGDQESVTDGEAFRLPDETGKSLQAAQDDLQAVSGNPFFVSFSEDATGEDRMQILDSGWQVCSQKPAAGTPVTQEDDITFFVVRVSEDCP